VRAGKPRRGRGHELHAGRPEQPVATGKGVYNIRRGEPAPDAVRIVHFTDLHVWQAWAWPWELLGKRGVGLLHLWLARVHVFPRWALLAALAHAERLQPDHVVVSGDLTQLSLPAEFRRARALLERFVPRLTVVPGNHDRYTLDSQRRRLFEQSFGELGSAAGFPTVQDLGADLRILGIDSSKPTCSRADASRPSSSSGSRGSSRVPRPNAAAW